MVTTGMVIFISFIGIVRDNKSTIIYLARKCWSTAVIIAEAVAAVVVFVL